MTIRHVERFHLLDGIQPNDDRVIRARATEQELTTAIPGGHGRVFGRDLSRRAVSAEFAGTGDVLAHPVHIEVQP